MKTDNQQPDMLKKDVYQVLGIMSGTSCDGVDIAHCNFILNNNNWQFEIKNADTFSYPEGLQHTLKNVTSLSAIDLALLDIELGFFFASQVNFFIDKNQILKTDLDFIASHGHTVFHQPQKKLTLQIGNGEALYQQTGIRVINNFREADVLAGGQGAPLVPIGDKLLFSDYDYCLNLGGISNISFDQQKKRVAFDIGPHNLAINLIAGQAGLAMDRNGEMAKKGKLSEDLKKQLDEYQYYQLPYPKSLGIENLQKDFFPILLNNKYCKEDIMHTLYCHLAGQIRNVISKHGLSDAKLLITGGGAHNKFFIEILKKYLSNQVEIAVPTAQIIDFKESLIFAFLGVLRARKELNIYKSVTGAEKDSCGGIMHGFFE